MTDFCKAQVTGTVTSGPTTQATGKKYVLLNDGNSSFKCIGLDADFTGIAVGDVVRCIGKFRMNQGANLVAVVDKTANPPYTGLSLAKLPSTTELGTLVVSATGTVTQAYTTWDANYKYFKMSLDTDPGEPPIVLKVIHSNEYANQMIAAGTQPVVNQPFTNGTQVYIKKIQDGQYLDPWTTGQNP